MLFIYNDLQWNYCDDGGEINAEQWLEKANGALPGNMLYVLDDGPLADKIMAAPYFEPVTDDEGNLIDITPVDPPQPPEPEPPEAFTPAEKRAWHYANIPCVTWEGQRITVDQANAVYWQYAAEGSPKAEEIQPLIHEQKEAARAKYRND
jgi:hypothetical protein